VIPAGQPNQAGQHACRGPEQLPPGAPLPTPELGHRFGFTKQALSKHIAILEGAGLVRRTVRGRVHDLTLVRAPLTEVTGWLAEVERGWQASLDRLDEVLRSTDG
jgi:DNA-binding transcriptional ArsR family regulator